MDGVKYFTRMTCVCPHRWDLGIDTCPLEGRRLRLRELLVIVEGQAAGQWQNWDGNPGLTLEPAPQEWQEEDRHVCLTS